MKNKQLMKQYATPFLSRHIIIFTVMIMCNGTVFSQTIPALPENKPLLRAGSYNIRLYWQGDSVNAKWEPHTALLIPVKLPGCPKHFFMQFDLGSPYSLFYKNKITAIRSRYPKAINVNDEDTLHDFSFKAGKMPVFAKAIVARQFDNSTIDWSKNSVEIIGTLGADFIDGKTVVIDYPKQQLTLAPSIPGKLLKQLSLADFVYTNRRILLPANIRSKQTLLYFDTGSSMYELLTNKQTSEIMAIPGSTPVQSKVNSWGRLLTANSYPGRDSIGINGKFIPVNNVTYIEGTSAAQAEQMMKMGIGGMTGNKLFLNYTLVLDTKNKKFGLIRE